MILPNDLPLSIKLWLVFDDYEHNSDPKVISATGLLAPIKEIILTPRVKEQDKITNVNSLVSSRIGRAIHADIENAWKGDIKTLAMMLGYPEKVASKIVLNPTKKALKADPSLIPAYMEQRTEKKINGYTITGQFDFIIQGRLEDFKSTKTYSYIKGTSDEKFAMQGSIYRWLNPEIITNDHMAIQYIFTDWSAAKVVQDPKYPKSSVVQKVLELKPVAHVERFISNKLSQIEKLKNADEDKIPPCNDEDLWRSSSVFKYYKNPEKKARSTKNSDTMLEAISYMNSKHNGVGVIDEVKGKVIKCRFCTAVGICKQKDTYILDGSLEL